MTREIAGHRPDSGFISGGAVAESIDIDDVRVGMYIQLEGGWWSHPFPVSSFRIATAAQLAQVRGLGLRTIRWVPEKSDLPGAATPTAAAAAAHTTADVAPAVPAAPAVVAVASPAMAGRSAAWEAARACEQQHAEASLALKGLLGQVAQDPQQAGRTSTAFTQAMLDKMLASDDVGIRLVSAGQDLATAHAMNVGVISMLVGRALGMAEEDLLDLGAGALLHDVGKTEVAERHRHLADGATSAETQAYRDHVVRGVALGQRMGLSAGALAVLSQHHERADGSGFPARLTNDRMSLAARVVAIVDRYENLCNPATRRPALTPHEAVSLLFAQSRQQFDGAVLNVFIRMMGVYPAGSLVQLTDDRYAMVMAANTSRPLKPRVLVHEPGVPRDEAVLLDLERCPDLGIRRSVVAHKVPAATLQYLDPRPRVAYYFEPLNQAAAWQELAA